MMKIKINFTDQWKDFDKTNNYFWNILSEKYDLELSDTPDFLIYGPFGFKYRKYDCIKIFLTGENIRPNFWECDYAFSFDYLQTDRNYRLPIYAITHDPSLLTQKQPIEEIIKERTGFCNFVYSNDKAKERIEFFNLLSKYKKVDSAGGVLNNVGYRVGDKMEFLKRYKFTISFENSSHPGYATEKILQPMLANSIPIYWGDPLVSREFNPKSFINVHDHRNFNEVIERVIEIDKDENLYFQMLSQPYFLNNQVPENLLRESVLKRFDFIFNQSAVRVPISSTLKPKISYMKKGLVNRTRKYLPFLKRGTFR